MDNVTPITPQPYITRQVELVVNGVPKLFLVSYNWMVKTISFTCRTDVTIQADFYLDRPFASREPADFLLIAEIQNYLDHSPEDRQKYYRHVLQPTEA